MWDKTVKLKSKKQTTFVKNTSMRCRLQHPLAAADDPQKRPRPLFFAHKTAHLDFSLVKIVTTNHHKTARIQSINRFVGGMLNNSGATKY
jgi:hypothetical protein